MPHTLTEKLREMVNEAICCGNTQRGGYCCGSPVPAILTDEAKARDFGVAVFNAWPEILAALGETKQPGSPAPAAQGERWDAARWRALCNLWAVSTILELKQEETGFWSIAQIEPAENETFKKLYGETPDDTINSAIDQAMLLSAGGKS